MGCLCEQQAEKNMQVSSTCIGHLWVFENLKPEEFGRPGAGCLAPSLQARAGSFFPRWPG